MNTHAILAESEHRPWPVPERPWAMRMSWCDLAFLHWPVAPEALRGLIPPALVPDKFEGKAWIGVVPLRMAGVRMRMAPPIPTSSEFPELNVRTYVLAGGVPGIWFFSLDAASRLAVRGARIACNLPYFDAAMAMGRSGDEVEYRSRRVHRGARPAEFRARYRPTGPVAPAEPGSLEHWLVERYCLFTVGRGKKVFQLDVQHHPWPLRPGEAEIDANTMAEAAGIVLPAGPPLLVHYAERLDVLAWAPTQRRDTKAGASSEA